MSARVLATVGLAFFAACVGVLVIAFARWTDALDVFDRSNADLIAVREQANEIRSLRGALDTRRIATTGSRADALAKVADTLAAAGLPESAMRSLDEQSDAELGETGLRRQTLRLALSGITPRELGLFLAALDRDHPEWGTARAELTRPRREDGNRYDVGLTLTRTYDPDVSSLWGLRP